MQYHSIRNSINAAHGRLKDHPGVLQALGAKDELVSKNFVRALLGDISVAMNDEINKSLAMNPPPKSPDHFTVLVPFSTLNDAFNDMYARLQAHPGFNSQADVSKVWVKSLIDDAVQVLRREALNNAADTTDQHRGINATLAGSVAAFNNTRPGSNPPPPATAKPAPPPNPPSLAGSVAASNLRRTWTPADSPAALYGGTLKDHTAQLRAADLDNDPYRVAAEIFGDEYVRNRATWRAIKPDYNALAQSFATRPALTDEMAKAISLWCYKQMGHTDEQAELRAARAKDNPKSATWIRELACDVREVAIKHLADFLEGYDAFGPDPRPAQAATKRTTGALTEFRKKQIEAVIEELDAGQITTRTEGQKTIFDGYIKIRMSKVGWVIETLRKLYA